MTREFYENQDKLSDDKNQSENGSSQREDGIDQGAEGSIKQGQTLKDLNAKDLHGENVGEEMVRKAINEPKNMEISKAVAVKMRLAGSLLYGYDQRVFDRDTARRMLHRIHGHLVIFPTEWLAREVESKNWFYSADRLPPIEIYDWLSYALLQAARIFIAEPARRVPSRSYQVKNLRKMDENFLLIPEAYFFFQKVLRVVNPIKHENPLALLQRFNRMIWAYQKGVQGVL